MFSKRQSQSSNQQQNKFIKVRAKLLCIYQILGKIFNKGITQSSFKKRKVGFLKNGLKGIKDFDFKEGDPQKGIEKRGLTLFFNTKKYLPCVDRFY